MKELYLKNRKEWRQWLKRNHALSAGIWLVYYKKHTGKPRIPYNDAVEEALCFGWIDSLVRKLDDDRYCQKFTPRKEASNWSDLNKLRVKRMTDKGLMTEAGLSKVRAAKKSGKWEVESQKAQWLEVPEDLERALKSNPGARQNFEKLSPSQRKNYIGWIATAKRSETRKRRTAEAVTLLEKNQKLGMK